MASGWFQWSEKEPGTENVKWKVADCKMCLLTQGNSSYTQCSIVCEAGEVGRESVRREFHIRTTRVLGCIPFAAFALEVGQKP